jgi:hypothetical protein
MEIIVRKKRAGKRGGRPTNRPDDKELLNVYKDYTSAEIGELFDVSASTVRTWVKLARRTQSEKEEQNE